MIIDTEGFGTQSRKEIIESDFYGLRPYPEGAFKAFLDIGGNVGFFSVMARMRHPDTPIFTFEPCTDTRVMLSYNAKHLNIQLFSFALGLGELNFMKYPNSGAHQFRKGAQGYSVKAITLPKMMEMIKQDGSGMFIKIDCEGGERVLLENTQSDKIIKRCKHLAMEIHFGRLFENMPPYEVWPKWAETFKDTHKVHVEKLGDNVGKVILISKG